MVALIAHAEPLAMAAEGTRCYATLAGREAPCEGCPVRSPSFEKGDAISILASTHDMWVARARRIARDSAEVTVHCLEIAVRTAKFHQASILKKLDVDSRLDLLRLLL